MNNGSHQNGFLPLPVLVFIGILALLGGIGVGVQQSLEKKSQEAVKETTGVPLSAVSDASWKGSVQEKEILESASSAKIPDSKLDDGDKKTEIISIVPPLSVTVPEAKEIIAQEKTEAVEELAAISAALSPGTTLINKFSFKEEWGSAIVDLLCVDKTENLVAGGGSGVIVDPRGVILTNAHVATDFLFGNWEKSNSIYNCSVRIGSPVKPRYRVQILYIPRGYIENLAAHLFDKDDSDYEYGFKDYALLFINGRTTLVNPYDDLPKSHPYLLPHSGMVPSENSFLYLSGYSSRFLSPQIILGMQSGFHRTTSPVVVNALRSLAGSSGVDILSFLGSVAGQYGASGGAVIKNDGKLVAVPTFYEDEPGETTDDSVLNAITVDYISRDLKSDTGLSLGEFIAREEIGSLAKQFSETKAVEYRCIYLDALRGHYGNLPFVIDDSDCRQ